MYLADLPLLDVGGVGIGEPEKALGKMTDNGVLVQKFLIVEFLRQHLLFGGGTNDGALVREDQLLGFDQLPCLGKKPGGLHHFQIKEKNAGIDVVGIDQVFAVVIPGGSIFVIGYVYIIKKVYIPIEKDIHVQIQQLIGHIRDTIREKTDQGVGGTIGILVGALIELFQVKGGDIYQAAGVFGMIGLDDLVKERHLLRGDGKIGVFDVGHVHGEHIKGEGFLGGGALEDRQGTGQHAVKNLVVTAKQNVNHGCFPPF